MVASPLAAFAAATGYQVIMFVVRCLHRLAVRLELTSRLVAVHGSIPFDLDLREDLQSRFHHHHYPFHAGHPVTGCECRESWRIYPTK